MTASPPAASALDAGLRLIAERLDVPAALVLAPGADGALRPVAATETWESDALLFHDVAGALATGGDALDVVRAIEGARFAAAAELGDAEGVLVVFGPEDRAPDDAWNEAFAASASLVHGLLRGRADRPDRSRLLYEIAVHPGTFDVRLGVALERAATALGMEAAAFAAVDGATWAPESVYDPSGRLVPAAPVDLDRTFCSVTTMADGAVGVEDAAASELAVESPAAYLGAPVFVEGRCVGTFSVASSGPAAPRSPTRTGCSSSRSRGGSGRPSRAAAPRGAWPTTRRRSGRSSTGRRWGWASSASSAAPTASTTSRS